MEKITWEYVVGEVDYRFLQLRQMLDAAQIGFKTMGLLLSASRLVQEFDTHTAFSGAVSPGKVAFGGFIAYRTAQHFRQAFDEMRYDDAEPEDPGPWTELEHISGQDEVASENLIC